MEKPLNVALIISSLGGPKLFNSLFTAGLRTDVVYLIHQRMPGSDFIQALVTCLAEDLTYPVHFLDEGEVALNPGHIYILCNTNRYKFQGSLVIAQRTEELVEEPYLDPLLKELQQYQPNLGIILLSGLLIEQDGLKTLHDLHKNNVQILATARDLAPVSQLIEEVSSAGLLTLELAPQQLLKTLNFPDSPAVPNFEPTLTPITHKWLVVDDDPDVREVIGEILEWEQISCDYARDGLDAVRKIQKHHYHAMLLDIKMPEMDGIQTLKALQTIDPHLPTLIVTGYDDIHTRKAAQTHSNVVGILPKPFMSEDLRRYMPSLLRGRPKGIKN